VLVHGWSCDRRYWRGQLAALADRHQVVAVDLAGHGGVRRRPSAVDHGGLRDDVAVETALRLGGQVLGVGGLLGAVVDECRRGG